MTEIEKESIEKVVMKLDVLRGWLFELSGGNTITNLEALKILQALDEVDKKPEDLKDYEEIE